MEPIIVKMQNDLGLTNYESSEIFQTNAYGKIGRILNEFLVNIKSYNHQLTEFVINCRRLNTIFIEGNRGSGKTTFLLNIKSQLQCYNAQNGDSGILKDLQFSQLIDPNLLDGSSGMHEKVLSTVIAGLFNQFQNEFNKPDPTDEVRQIFQAVDRVAQSFKGLQEQPTSGLEKIVSFQSNLRLEQHLHEFFRALKTFFKVKAIVLLIDDTDMAIKTSAEVIDTIRRYLSSPYVIPIVTGQRSLYMKMLRNYFVKEVSFDKRSECTDKDVDIIRVSQSCFDKVFPVQHRIHLKSFPEIARSQPINIEFADKTSIPLILLNEVHKRILYRGVASRHYKDVYKQSREQLTARMFLQRNKLHYEEIKLVNSAYKKMQNNPEEFVVLYFDLFYTDLKNEKRNQIIEDISKQRKDEDFPFLTYSDMPFLVNAICADFFHAIYPESDEDIKNSRFAELLRKWAKHESHYHLNKEGIQIHFLKWDCECLVKNRFSTYLSFKNSIERIKDKFKDGNKSIFEIRNIDLVPFPAPSKSKREQNEKYFFLKLFSEVLPTSHGMGKENQVTTRKFVHFLFRMFDHTNIDVSDYYDILDIPDDKKHYKEGENAAHDYLSKLLNDINDWHNKYHLSFRWIGSYQMDIVLKKFQESLDGYFTADPPKCYTLQKCASEIAYIFLNALSWSEKERHVIERNFGEYELTSEGEKNDIYQTNLKKMFESSYNSLSKIYCKNPIIKRVLSGKNALNTIKLFTLSIESVLGDLLDFIDNENELVSVSIFSERFDVFARRLNKLRLNQKEKKEIVARLMNSTKFKKLFSLIPQTQKNRITKHLDLKASEFQGK